LLAGKKFQVPLFSSSAKIKGWPYVIAWCHRISGLLLVAFVLFHIYAIQSLGFPDRYNADMKLYDFFILRILEWALSIPVIFHALNGGRLILYESFGVRDDRSMIEWLFGLAILYVAILGILMLMGTQSVSPFFFWLLVMAGGLSLASGALSKVWDRRHSLPWRLQRLTAAFLLVMLPAHMLFMHLNPSMAKDAEAVVVRLQSGFMKFVDLLLLLALVFHGGYGLVSIAKDYLSSRALTVGLAVLIALTMLVAAWAGIRITLTV